MKIYQIYETYQEQLIRYAFSLSRQWEDAEDLAQQAYIKALEQYEMFEQMHPMQIRGWLYTTVKRLYIDQYRKQKRLVHLAEDYKMGYEAFIEDHLVTSDLLMRLPENLRTVVALRYISGYNSTEIGEQLSMKPSTVRSRLSQAIEFLRTALEDR